MAVSRPNVPELADIATLRTQTSSTILERRVFLRNTTGSDRVASHWYLIDDQAYDGTYDDGAMHVVDASSRIWARGYEIITEKFWGVTAYDTWLAASTGTAHHVELQKCLDFWADPIAWGRNKERNGTTPSGGGLWNEFKGWARRPAADKLPRPLYLGADQGGYIRIQETIYIDTSMNQTVASFNKYFKPGPLEFKARPTMDANISKPCVAIRLGRNSLDREIYLLAQKSHVDLGGGNYETAWYNRTNNADPVLDRYPQQAFPNTTVGKNWTTGMSLVVGQIVSHTHPTTGHEYVYESTANFTSNSAPVHTTGTVDNLTMVGAKQWRNGYRNWYSGMTVYKNDYITNTHSDGSEWLYKSLAHDTTHSVEPTHPTGTANDLQVIAEYITPNGHSYEDLLTAEQDCCFVILGSAAGNKRIHMDGIGAAVQCMFRPKGAAIPWSEFSMGVGYDCKINTAVAANINIDFATEWVNENKFYYSASIPHIAGGTYYHGTDASLYGIVYFQNTNNEKYRPNNNKHYDISLEVRDRTGNAVKCHVCMLQGGHSETFTMRCDDALDDYVAILGRNWEPNDDADDCKFSSYRRARIVENANFHTFDYQETATSEDTYYIDYLDFYAQGSGDPGGNILNRQCYFKDLWELNPFGTGVIQTGVFPTVPTDGDTGIFYSVEKGWSLNPNSHFPVAIFDIIDTEGTTTVSLNNAFITADVAADLPGSNTALGTAGGAKIRVFNLTRSGERIPTDIYPGVVSASQNVRSAIFRSGGMYDTNPYYAIGSVQTYSPNRFGIPAHVERVGIMMGTDSAALGIKGFRVTFRGTRRAVLIKPAQIGLMSPPAMGHYRAGQRLPMMNGGEMVLAKTAALAEKDYIYYGVSGPFATISYTKQDLIYTGSKTSAKIFVARASGTASGSAPVNDGDGTGVVWTLVADGVRVCEPSDWTIVPLP